MAPRDYIQFHDGFETQDLSRCYTSSGGATESAVVSLSKRAWRWNVAAATGFAGYGQYLNADGTHYVADGSRSAIVSFHMRITTWPPAGTTYALGTFDNVGTYPSFIYLHPDGYGVIYNGSSGTYEGFAPPEVGKWYVVTYVYHHGGGANASLGLIIRERDTGTELVNMWHTQNANMNWHYFMLGPMFTSTGNVVFDNFVICSDPTWSNLADPVSFLTTRYACGLLTPNAAGSQADWTGDYTSVDEVPNDGNASYQQRDQYAGAFTHHMTSPNTFAVPAREVFSVLATAYVLGSVATGCVVAARIRKGGAWVDTSGYDPGSAAWAPIHKRSLIDPATAVYWTVPGVDAVEAGVNRISTGVTSSYCTAVYLDVLFRLGSGSSQVIWAGIERWRQFLRDLRQGLVPPDDLRRCHRDLLAI